MNVTGKAIKGFEINIRNEFKYSGISEKQLGKVARKILTDLGFKKGVVNILLVGDRQMRAMNRKFLEHAWSTDVLAFGQGKLTKAVRPAKINWGPGGVFLGDIALCIPTIEGQAEEYGHSFKEELDYCLCHGILHLLGHNDKTQASHKRMHRKQKQILKRIAPGS